ncbi:hypothetical protein TNCV_3543331 [Trichonephila clavipes]|nr:hypothetical protein TNCV_3543331 [Trichonephila clavipes]
MYKNALKEDLIRVVEDLDGTVESTDTIANLKTKIENSSTFESDPDFILLWSRWKRKKDVPLRTAYSQNGRCGMQPKAKTQSSRAGAASETKTETMRTESVETFELVRRTKTLKREKRERERCASRRYLLHIIVKLIC